MNGLNDFFAAKHFSQEHPASHYDPLQIGATVQPLQMDATDWGTAGIVLLGCGERRGAGSATVSMGPEAVREALYNMYHWHTDVQLADAGNILIGEHYSDTNAALSTVIRDIKNEGKKSVIIGGSHDLTLAQYKAFQIDEQLCNLCVIDSKINLDEEETLSEQGFLMNLLTHRPNFVRQYTHIGFQSYYVHPTILQTLDSLRFDCYRLGVVREDMDLVEPSLRDCDILSIDLMCLRASEAPWLAGASPNGFFSDELCQLVRYAGMSNKIKTLGIYNYDAKADVTGQGAELIAQLIWYFADGVYAQRSESSLSEMQNFDHFDLRLTDTPTTFLRSHRSGRWWMLLPNGKYVPCSYNDYQTAAADQVPERWLREQERIV